VAATPELDITSPLFREITIHLDNDYYRAKTFTIKAKGNSDKNIYIQKMWLNGREWHSTRIPFSAIVNGGELTYQMGAEPNYEWFEE
jgi:putative alpha-1,2-mannosidase